MHQRMTSPKQHTATRLILSLIMIVLAVWSFLADPILRTNLIAMAAVAAFILAGVMIVDMRARRK